ncbi:GlxA family transcriptional regulator [Aliiroseovarius lamellibrachiae]|uniref:GlxA family transcriptional regulator n=1 Tax=Aliiroseovarius lamellibrachiae TaxID=1924933 RepID=UPI001BDF7FA5|nr:helix-turn-helix domain-containing protein [Aliiroseovarius lamellibrachiae]MBT2132328.1 helix-turn-helix domain-containing protein [Aliiroseovarius lamellibrachiae]
MTETIDLLLFDHFSGLCLANTVEPLRAANDLARKRLYSWRFLTIDGENVRSSSGMQVQADGRLSDHRGDLLVAMPSYNYRTHATPKTSRALAAASRRYGQMAGFDTGAWLLAQAGLLDGYSATIHWEELPRFEEHFPDVSTVRQRHVLDRDRLTCTGALAAFDMVLDRIGSDHGAALRLELAMLFMAPGAAASVLPPMARSRIVARALSAMRGAIEDPHSIPEIAKIAGCTVKELEQRIRTELGETPSTTYRRLRLISARKAVLETDLSIAEVAVRAGYENASAMTRAFKSEFGVSPRALRLEVR